MESVVEKFITDLEKLKKKQEEEKRKRDEVKRIKREERRKERMDAKIALEIEKEVERLFIPCRMCGEIFRRSHHARFFCGSAKQKTGCSYKNMRILQKKHKKKYRAEYSVRKREMKKLRLEQLNNNSM